MLALLWRFRHYIAYLAIAAAIAGGIWYYGHRQHAAGNAEGEARITVKWQADNAARDRATQAAIDSALKRERDALQHNDEVVNDYTKKLAAAVGSRDEYFGLLQRARGQVRSLTSAQAGGAESVIAACAATGTERLDSAIAAALVESRANADELDALIAVVTPQL